MERVIGLIIVIALLGMPIYGILKSLGLFRRNEDKLINEIIRKIPDNRYSIEIKVATVDGIKKPVMILRFDGDCEDA